MVGNIVLAERITGRQFAHIDLALLGLCLLGCDLLALDESSFFHFLFKSKPRQIMQPGLWIRIQYAEPDPRGINFTIKKIWKLVTIAF